ncbi:hypothetical protein [Pedococcus sp. 2YAF34]|uniref:hypothetical protein n=1 Tax=Pedococcus sp. 2YAF34 TaxID=3233032 RepID=UPI003F96918A
MTAAPQQLRAVPVREDSDSHCTLVCQATLSGPQATTVRVLTPVTGPGRPHLAVRIGSILLLMADRQALRSVSDAVRRAQALADTAYGTYGTPHD